jgi:galactokinase
MVDNEGASRTCGQEMTSRIETLLTQHRLQTDASVSVYQAPGRVNLLGEHTDYSGGFCMPAALSFNTLVAISPRNDRHLRLRSLDFRESVELDLADLKHPGSRHWSAYPAGVAWSLGLDGVDLRGADLTISGNVPIGAGLSSSASVEIAAAVALLALAQVEMTKPQIALACQKAENDYVGAPCGIMDQFISACGVRGHALAIDTRTLASELAPIPEGLRLVVCNSMVRHSIGGGEYGERRREVEEAAKALKQRKPSITQLRDATLADLEAAESFMSHNAFRRARHVITDSRRVLEGTTALRRGDLSRFGALMTEAHSSFRDDFAASCDECDLLVQLAHTLSGCLGSRLTGGGFGGCTVSLVEADAAQSFAQTLQRLYREETKIDPQTFICEIVDGAGPVPVAQERLACLLEAK